MEKQMLRQKGERGITLIALIITIIVLLILTGVTIATLTGENGILTQAKNAKKEMTKAEAKERIQLEVLGSYGTDGEINIATLKANIAKNIPEAVIGEERELPLTVTVGDYTFTVKANGVLEEATPATVEQAVVGEIVTGDNKPYTKNGTAIIPVGFAIVPGLDDVSEGLVISDVANDTADVGNQFVWIPVTKENPFKIRAGYENGSLQDISNYGEAGSTEINAKITESATTQAEAIAMYASVETNGGFYIGRYEAGVEYAGVAESASQSGSGSGIRGALVTKKGAYAYNQIGWNDSGDMADETGGAVEIARNFAKDNGYDTTKVHSTLCYGVQWDTALNFIDPGYKGYAKENLKMGWNCNNYNRTNLGNTETNPKHLTGKDLIYNSEVTGSGSASGSESTSGSGIVIPAGEPTNKHKNIYDMAGNVNEWTMETYDDTDRVRRGGEYGITGYNLPSASTRMNQKPNIDSEGVGFRLALYL